jgi:polyferredoxin
MEIETMDTQSVDGNSLYGRGKKLNRRFVADRSQRIRHCLQGLFVALNGWIGIQFFLWVHSFERGGSTLYVPRPAGVEGWLLIAGFMNFKYFLRTGRVPTIHPAAMFLFIAFLLMCLLLKKAFCA